MFEKNHQGDRSLFCWGDRIVFEKTGQHLDDLQEAVLKGTLERETYKQIAKDFDCSESSVRKVGSELWQILSQELGEDISKSNLRSAMERLQVSLFSNVVQDYVGVGSINICGEGRHPPDISKSHPDNDEKSNAKPTKYEEYRSLFKQIEKLSHQSCFLLVGWEAPK